MLTVSLVGPLSGGISMIVMKYDENLTNVQKERITSTESDNLEAISKGLQPVIT